MKRLPSLFLALLFFAPAAGTLQGTFSLDEENVYMCALTDAVIESVE